MPPGLTGNLLASTFLEHAFRDHVPGPHAVLRRWGVRALAAWHRRAAGRLGPASGPRAVLDVGVLPLLDVLGFDVLALEPRDHGYAGLVAHAGRPVAALAVVPPGTPIERTWRELARAARVSGTRWGIACTAMTLAVFDAVRPWSRRALVCELELALGDEHASIAVWELCRAAALTSESGLAGAIAASERGTSALCTSLGEGVLGALASLAGALRRPGDTPHERFDQSLTLVYRVLFLLFAEARGLVPTWHPVYRDSYSVGALRDRLVSGGDARGFGEALRAMSRLAHAGCRVGTLRVTAFNGPLFSPRRVPSAESRPLPDVAVRDLLLALATTTASGARQPAAYADLGVEELGAIYERVLEFEPDAGGNALSRTSTARKTSGSFYTPRSITRFLVRRTLAPLVHERSAAEILDLRIVDPAMGSGAFLVAACEFLAAACEEARLASGEWQPADVTAASRAALRREIGSRCLFGVDQNPMAVQLAQLSLWLTTLAADRPLTFLDHHLLCGDSLRGARLADLHRLPGVRPGARQPPALPLFEGDGTRDVMAAVLPDRLRLAVAAAEPAEVRDQERRHARLMSPGTPLGRLREACDIWSVAWHDVSAGPGLTGDLIAHALGRPAMLGANQARPLLARAATAAARLRPVHWELAFPEVFFDADGRRRPDGGFDAVLGNPPWEMVRADTGGAVDREAARRACRDELAFVRRSGLYRFQGGGQVNRYQLFVERALQIARPGARIGLILPGGFASDHGSAALRRRVLDGTAVDTLASFENRAGVFPIHRSMRFLLLVTTAGLRTERFAARFGLTDPDVLDTWGDRAGDDPPDTDRLSLSRGLLDRWDPGHLSIPDLPSPRDLAIVDRAVRHAPRLADGSGWGARFGRELNATDDRRHFIGHASGGAVPVAEGKHLASFRADLTACAAWLPRDTAAALLPDGAWTRARLAYRDVAGAGNRLTLIAAMLPPFTVSTHTVFCLRTCLPESDQHCLLALLNSLVANYLVRRRVSVHVTTALMHALPVPRPPSGSRVHRRLGALARRLMEGGLEGAPDAWVTANTIAASLYHLTPDDYRHVLRSFPLIEQGIRDECMRDYERATALRG
ncbi:MAG: N-6 DNA methylase [Vicinamibacterales bacterium]